MNELLDLHPKKWKLLISPPRKQLLVAIAYIAYDLPMIVLDCGRQFDSSIVARAAHGRQEIIDRIKIQRAFTCHEAVKLLDQIPVGRTPVIILDFLSTFYDQNVKMNNRRFLLENSINHFRRLSNGAGLAVSIYPPKAGEDTHYLFERLQSTAPYISVYGSAENKTSQLRFF